MSDDRSLDPASPQIKPCDADQASAGREHAPTVDEIERRFSSRRLKALRPAMWGCINVLKVIRGYDWQPTFDHDLERLRQPLIFAANHRSHADTAAILGTLPKSIKRRTAVAAALDVFGPDSNNGLRRKLSKDALQLLVGSAFHAFAFDRQGPPLRSVRTSVQLIRNGWNLLLYPEGTRSRNGEMGEFKAGVGLLARFTKCPVIPVHVDGGEDILPYGVFMPQAGFAHVRYGLPLTYQADDTPTGFVARLEEQVRQLGHRHAAPAAAWAPTDLNLARAQGG